MQSKHRNPGIATLSQVVAVPIAEPRVRLVPDGDDAKGLEAIEVAESLKLDLDDHQRMVLLDGCRTKPDGKWSAFEVGVCEPRQNGKGVILEIREIAGLFAWSEPLVVHSAHQFDTSSEHFFRILNLIEESDLERQIKRIARGHGEEGIILKNGCRMRFRTRTKGGGRGFSCDLLVLDESMILAEAAHGALLPTMRARPNPQVWYAGSAVDQEVHEHGVVFARLRERGIEGKDRSMAYFEWSLPFENPGELTREDAADPANWARANPALGIRIWPEHVAMELETMNDRTFAVEILGVGDWPRTDGTRLSPIKPDEWDALLDETSVLEDPICLAYDVSPERRTSIAAAGRRDDGLWHVEVISQWPGTKWLVPRLAELVELHEPLEVVCDGYGPAASVAKQVIDAGIEVRMLNSNEHAQACGQLADSVIQQTLRHLGSQSISNALRGAATRPLGDAWAWSRKSSSVDISPLVAVTLALSSAQAQPEDDGGDMVIY